MPGRLLQSVYLERERHRERRGEEPRGCSWGGFHDAVSGGSRGMGGALILTPISPGFSCVFESVII